MAQETSYLTVCEPKARTHDYPKRYMHGAVRARCTRLTNVTEMSDVSTPWSRSCGVPTLRRHAAPVVWKRNTQRKDGKKKTQLDPTRDNTPIHHRSRGDSTSLHSDSSQHRTHTHTHARTAALQRVQAQSIQQPMSAPPLTSYSVCSCVCVCVSLHWYPHILFIYMRAREHSVSGRRDKGLLYFSPFASVWMNVSNCVCVL